MTGDTTPQQQAVELAETFARFVPASDATSQELVREISDYLLEGWSCPPDAQRMLARAAVLLCSSPDAQPQEEDQGRFAPEPSATPLRHDVYVQYSTSKVHRTSCHSDNTVNVDLDKNGVPVGIEVIGAIGLEVDGKAVELP